MSRDQRVNTWSDERCWSDDHDLQTWVYSSRIFGNPFNLKQIGLNTFR